MPTAKEKESISKILITLAGFLIVASIMCFSNSEIGKQANIDLWMIDIEYAAEHNGNSLFCMNATDVTACNNCRKNKPGKNCITDNYPDAKFIPENKEDSSDYIFSGILFTLWALLLVYPAFNHKSFSKISKYLIYLSILIVILLLLIWNLNFYIL
jgi:hypothetical protein